MLISSYPKNQASVSMVRTTSKLENLLAENKVPASKISQDHLTIIEGNAKDPAAVSRVLQLTTVDIIVSGIGGAPTFSNPLKPGLEDPTICEDATSTILSALRDQPPARKPLFIVISTTGVSELARDVPLLMLPLYHWILPVAHKDKANMECLLVSEAAKPADQACIRGFVAVRPSMLTNGPRLLGTETTVRAGTDANPAVGYTISRADVGAWIFEELIRERADGGEKWVGEKVSITY
ncbi:MAG: hypothetical protein M1837_005983 [Sclerophora amabilis]|nr:MAG: hypothetical protein M1837_005983 [Sclerophora amabilis]